jgi:hypothetical protein
MYGCEKNEFKGLIRTLQQIFCLEIITRPVASGEGGGALSNCH